VFAAQLDGHRERLPRIAQAYSENVRSLSFPAATAARAICAAVFRAADVYRAVTKWVGAGA